MALTPVLTDTFNRANEALESSSNWDDVNFYYGNGSAIVSNVLDFGGSGHNINHAANPAHDDDQYAEADLSHPTGYGDGRSVTIGVRLTGTLNGSGTDTINCYMWVIDGNGASVLQKYEDGTPTNLYTGPTHNAGDTIRIEVTGQSTTTISVYINDVLEDAGSGYTAQDTTSPFLSGAPCLGGEAPGSLDNWVSGDITADGGGSGPNLLTLLGVG